MKRKGFTLLELVVVIIIVGILATLGVTQYSSFVEKSRGAEAKAILGDIRKFAAAYYVQNNGFGSFAVSDVNIGAGMIPGPAATDCAGSHYFWYNATASGTAVTIKATRCEDTAGKQPGGAAVDPDRYIQLVSNFSSGSDTWSGLFYDN